MGRPSIVFTTTDGRGILGISREQAITLDRTMRRYFTWVESGRKFDPWQSGVASASRFDGANSKHHKSSGAFGPGRCSEPDLPTDLVKIDGILPSLSVLDRLLITWHWGAQPLRSCDMAERLGISLDVFKGDWRRAQTRLFFRVSGE